MTTPTPTETPARRAGRPATIWVVVVIGVLQGLVLLLAGTALLVLGGEVDVAGSAGDSEAVATALGVTMAVLGLAQLLVAFFLARGGHRARALFGALVVLQIAFGVYSIVALRDFQVSGIVQLLVSVGILWLLYGAVSSDRFFAS